MVFRSASVALGPEFLSSDPRLSALTTRGRSYGTPPRPRSDLQLVQESQLVRAFHLLIRTCMRREDDDDDERLLDMGDI